MGNQENDNSHYEEIDTHYELESVEQLQAISDPIRYRMVLLLREKAMTGAQLARAMDLSRSRAHYFLKNLVDADLVRFCGEKIENGMIGKYYRARAGFFSYDNLATESREISPTDLKAMQILKAISDFALTVLETSRDDFQVNKGLAHGYHFNFETYLNEQQYSEIIDKLRSVADRLIEIKRENQTSEKQAGFHFRTTIFFTPTPRNPIQRE